MAEVKKSLKLQKLVDKTLKEFTGELGSAEGKPEGGSALAATASMAASLALLAASACPEGSVSEDTIKELPELSNYMLKQVDDFVRSRSPLMLPAVSAGMTAAPKANRIHPRERKTCRKDP